MNIHEYQAKEIFRKHGIPVPWGEVAETPEQAKKLAADFGKPVVVKAQVHAGGRGKAGGVKLAAGAEEAETAAGKILGMEIKGLTVRKVLVTEAMDIAAEIYVGVLMDRKLGGPLFMVSAAGGIDIEQVARETPEKIHKFAVDPLRGLRSFEARNLAFRVMPDADSAKAAAKIFPCLYQAFADSDASLAEINPLIVTKDGEVWAIDAKMNIDDNGLDRRPEIAALRDADAEAPEEGEARNSELSYVKLDGNVGCVVNGAGLAMATMDLIKHHGGDPANFLDIGGSSSPEKVTTAMRIIYADKNVKSILFNIFGGITRCDDVARGIVEAVKGSPPPIPIVVRLTGTNEEEGRKILGKTDLIPAATMDEAVQKAVELAETPGGTA
ncbi:MAG: ADP-forming succinate--CoA ligase subunit beta [Candidatus Eisenbacteria sp.]|nr:ADP-forming succinate--CoA ligase subunit beta [Candidatus Eisenbacteria bacterium]